MRTGGHAMWISCWNCGQDVWLETQKQCRHCDAPTHRCADCENYDPAGPRCAAQDFTINPCDAERPSRLSLSFNCAQFRMTEEAAQRRGAAAHTSATRPAAAAAPTAPPAAAPPSAGEVITIRREPPLKHPKLPLVIAHRGDSASAPENTLTALKAAIAAGAHAVEFDVHLTKDGHPVVIHDATVERCTNGKGAVASLTLEQIKALDAGSWFAGPFAGEEVPTLDEALAALPAPAVLFIHLRAHENECDRCERAVVEAIARHDTRKRTCVTHHTRHGLSRLRELDPALRLCWIPYGGEPGEEYVDDAYLLGTRFMQPRAAEIDECFVAYARSKGMWINAFWADEIAEMERLIRLGVDGIVTNYPRRLRDTLKAFA
jgi:glycerophosphoryl diester phosphodiesterase